MAALKEVSDTTPDEQSLRARKKPPIDSHPPAQQGDRYMIGDLIGEKRLLTPEQRKFRYYLTGFFLVVRK